MKNDYWETLFKNAGKIIWTFNIEAILMIYFIMEFNSS